MNAVHRWYVRGGAYVLNNALAGRGDAMTGEDRRLARRFIAEFDQVKPLTEPMVLYRGVGRGSYVNQRGQYLSASDNFNIALTFTDHDLTVEPSGRPRAVPSGEVLILNVQPGVKVLHIGGIQREWVIDASARLTEVYRTTNDTPTDRSTRVWVIVTQGDTTLQ